MLARYLRKKDGADYLEWRWMDRRTRPSIRKRGEQEAEDGKQRTESKRQRVEEERQQFEEEQHIEEEKKRHKAAKRLRRKDKKAVPTQKLEAKSTNRDQDVTVNVAEGVNEMGVVGDAQSIERSEAGESGGDGSVETPENNNLSEVVGTVSSRTEAGGSLDMSAIIADIRANLKKQKI